MLQNDLFWGVSMKARIKAAANEFARAFGLEMIPIWRKDSLHFERFLRELFALYSIDAVIDVGANLGQYRDFVRLQVGFDGWIVSFEPDPLCVAQLRERAKGDKKWHIEPVALGRENGQLDFHVTADSHFNSFLLAAEQGTVAEQYKSKSRVVRNEKVAIRTLDEYQPLFAKLGIAKPYLKLDTQGFDLEVLRGASAFLREVRALQTEASVRAIYEGMPDYQETVDFLSECGFHLSNTFPVCHDAALRLIEFDCVAVNTRFADALERSKG